MSQSFVPLSLETVVRVFVAPHDRPEGVLSMPYKKLVLLLLSRNKTIPLKKGLNQIRASNPRPVRVPK